MTDDSQIVGQFYGDDTVVVGPHTIKGKNIVCRMCRLLVSQGVNPEATIRFDRDGLTSLKPMKVGWYAARSLKENDRWFGYVKYQGISDALKERKGAKVPEGDVVHLRAQSTTTDQPSQQPVDQHQEEVA